jgi:hypothetical protein
MQKVPALLKVRQEQSKNNSERNGRNEKTSRICALLTAKRSSVRLYTSVVDNEYSGQDKHTINTLNNTR